MTFSQSIETCLKKYFVFDGVATRSEYWYFQLFQFVLSLFGTLVVMVTTGQMSNPDSPYMDVFANVLTAIFFIPNLAVSIRRMHDINKVGWWILVPLYNIYLLIQPSVHEKNRFTEKASATHA